MRLWLSFHFVLVVFAQSPSDAGDTSADRWNVFYQATSVGQYHGSFHSLYEGDYSLRASPERDVSLTTTLYFGFRLAANTQFYVDPEIAGGRGFSHVNGIANFPNGELPRVASATPKPYIARAYLTQDFAFGPEKEQVESDVNQLGGERPMNRYSISVGRFTVTDFFDINRYTHDPRTQFMGWGVIYNGAWDYPADTRGYTWGWVHEFHTQNWSFRYGSAAEPRVANGLRFDRRLLRDRADMFEGERRYQSGGHRGVIRFLSFKNYTRSGTYSEAIRLGLLSGQRPGITAMRRPGTLKYGFGINAEQELAKDIGIFGRFGWNDGKTESFAFTAIDRLVTGGISVTGARWQRKFDTVAAEVTASGLSAVHAAYLAGGGLDFLLGDGALRYGSEIIWESYYNARLIPGLFAAFDLQHVTNPAFNRDRGPVWISSLRLHVEFGNDVFTSRRSTP